MSIYVINCFIIFIVFHQFIHRQSCRLFRRSIEGHRQYNLHLQCRVQLTLMLDEVQFAVCIFHAIHTSNAVKNKKEN